MRRYKLVTLLAGLPVLTFGCATRSPMPETAQIREPILPPGPLPANTLPAVLPVVAEIPVVRPKLGSNLKVDDVLASVTQSFPLLLSIQEERGIAAADRLTAEGAFDLQLRSNFTSQEGSFGNRRFDVVAEQPLARSGGSAFAGYRTGLGDFAVYNGGQKTSDGGELRAGVQVPLLRDAPIDRRRAALRQAQISQQLAEPVIKRALLDIQRNAARSYWGWVAAGEQYRIARGLLKLAEDRQEFFEGRLKAGNEDVIRVDDNRRSIFDRRGRLLSVERLVQQSALELSLYLRDDAGLPMVPTAAQLPAGFFDAKPIPVNPDQKEADVQSALAQRPEVERFELLKQRLAVDLKLALNQFNPALNVGAVIAQDLGDGKKSFTGTDIFASDTTNASAFVTFEMPWQRREAQGRARKAMLQMNQLLQQERFARDSIRTEVLDSHSNLTLTADRLQQARLELSEAEKVADNEKKRVIEGGRDIVDLNLRELNAAEAQSKAANTLAEFYRAYADYLAATGRSGSVPPAAAPVK